MWMAALCIIGYFAAALTSTHWVPLALPSYNNQKYLKTLPQEEEKGAKLSFVEHCSPGVIEGGVRKKPQRSWFLEDDL